MRKLKNILNYIKIYFGIIFTVAFFVVITVYIFVNGIPNLSFNFLFGNDGLMPVVLTTLIMIALTLLIAVPVGIGSAIYLCEYARQKSPFVRAIRLATETLSGIPSIIFGLFGFLFFVLALGWSWSLLAGICTLSIMVLPTVMRSTEEALKAVPISFRENSYALGAGKLRTIIRVVLPSAIPGILAAIILSIGRIVGESAALVLTAGTVAGMPKGLFSSGATLSVYMYSLVSEGMQFGKAYATAIILMLTVFVVNILASFFASKLRKDK